MMSMDQLPESRDHLFKLWDRLPNFETAEWIKQEIH